MKKTLATLAVSVSLLPALWAGPDMETPALRVLDSSRRGAPVLENGDFDKLEAERPVGWRPWKAGFRVAPGEGRGDSSAIVCESRDGRQEHGASATIRMDRDQVLPLIIRGHSRAEDVSGAADRGYSLYVDILYRDGTPLWGQTADFSCGTHPWEKKELVILPEKPVKSLTVHCLFRNHAGKVWFDDVSVEEVRIEGDAALFQGLPVQVGSRRDAAGGPTSRVSSRDGLELEFQGDSVVSLEVEGRQLAAESPAGFIARDVAGDSDFLSFKSGRCEPLGLQITREVTGGADHVAVSGRIHDTSRRDRAITLLFALPLDATGWQWGDNIHEAREITGRSEYSSTSRVRCGSTGTMSVYPLAAVWNDAVGLALAIDMDCPAVYRLAFNSGTRQLVIAYDFGLVPETEGFPSAADFRFVLYRFDPRWGFRAAFAKLQRIFPRAFSVRSRKQGIWMPFTDVSTVDGWEDFGFRYHEGNNNVPFDDTHGILSFRYTEPMTWWMPMAGGRPRTENEAHRVREELASGNNPHHRRMAGVAGVAAMHGSDERPALVFRDTPWCNGAVWSINPNPRLPGDPNGATVYWNESLKARLYGTSVRGKLDGEYLDSLEGYVTSELNFRRVHFRHTTVPLTFSRDSGKPALFKGLAVFEFLRWISKDVRGMGKLVFANGVPYRFSFLCPWLDVLGTETNWLSGGAYRPPPPARLALWRTMCGGKPYLILMNTDYDAFTPPLVERYFQQSLLYGFYPGMFSHNASENPYWKRPAWYNRDRHLFKRYIPVIRQVAEAGWHPVTGATCNTPGVQVERFGPDPEGALYFTIRNATRDACNVLLKLHERDLELPPEALQSSKAVELLAGETLPREGTGFRIRLEPGRTRAVRLTAGKRD